MLILILLFDFDTFDFKRKLGVEKKHWVKPACLTEPIFLAPTLLMEALRATPEEAASKQTKPETAKNNNVTENNPIELRLRYYDW